jgi:Tfp pilus assembly PilM family ATPase
MATPSAVAKLVRRGMRAGKFRGRKVVSALPPEHVRVMSVSYAANTTDSAAASIARLMADRVEGSLTEYVIDYVPIRMNSHDGDRLALVAVSRIEHASSYLDGLAAAGLHVDFLEIGPLALKRLISSAANENKQEHVFVVNVGETSSKLTTISGERLLANQEISFGEAAILDAVATSLDLAINVARDLIMTNGLDPARLRTDTTVGFNTTVAGILVEIVRPEFLKLVREIERAFRFADSESHGNCPKKIIVVGGIAHWSGAAKLLGSLTNTPVECLGRSHMPFAGHADDITAISDEQAAEMSTAVGLALRGMIEDE